MVAHMRHVSRATWLPLLVLLPVACAKSGPALVPVSGRVTIENRPLANAVVSFTPAEVTPGNPPVESSGRTDADGKLSLELNSTSKEGALVGTHLVRIALFDRGDGKTPAKGQVVPAEYNQNSKVTFSVPPGGTTDANFALEGALRSQPKR